MVQQFWGGSIIGKLQEIGRVVGTVMAGIVSEAAQDAADAGAMIPEPRVVDRTAGDRRKRVRICEIDRRSFDDRRSGE